MTDTHARMILPENMTDEMWEAGEAAVSESFAMKYGNGMAARRIYKALLAASPNAGRVSAEQLEKMLASKPFEDGDETVEQIIRLGLAAKGFALPSFSTADVLITALASIGLEVE
jgi:hypothetical protein